MSHILACEVFITGRGAECVCHGKFFHGKKFGFEDRFHDVRKNARILKFKLIYFKKRAIICILYKN